MKRLLPSQSYLEDCFIYNEKSGLLTWKLRPDHHFKSSRGFNSFNKKFAHKEAGCKKYKESLNNYLLVGIDGILYRSHRVIYKLYYGIDPDVVDHEDGNGLNNSITNIVDKTDSGNSRNQRLQLKSKSGFTGVSYQIRDDRWYACIKINGKVISLGTYKKKSDAINARKIANIKYNFHENHGNKRGKI